MTITEQNRRSFLYVLRTGRSIVVTHLFSYFPCTFGRQLENILLDPVPVLGTAARVATEVTSMASSCQFPGYGC